MSITITQARAHLGALLDEIERTKKPVTIRRRGQPDVVLSPGTGTVPMQDAALTLFLALLAEDIEAHPERLNALSRDLLARIAKLTSGVPIDHDAPIEAVTGLDGGLVNSQQESSVNAKASRGNATSRRHAHRAQRSSRKRPPKGNTQ